MKVKSVTSFNNEDSRDTRTIGIKLDGKTLVSTANYGGHSINVTIHQLGLEDVTKLIYHLVEFQADMLDARNSRLRG